MLSVVLESNLSAHDGGTPMEQTLKMTTPKVDERPDQHYMGIRTRTTMENFADVIPRLNGEVFDWLAQHGIAPAGPPLCRYYVIDMPGNLDVELGVPVATMIAGDERVRPNVMPAGRYASLVYTGVQNGIAGNAALLAWGVEQGLAWDQWETSQGDAFGGRVEYFLTGPENDPDPAQWDTEVAIRLVD